MLRIGPHGYAAASQVVTLEYDGASEAKQFIFFAPEGPRLYRELIGNLIAFLRGAGTRGARSRCQRGYNSQRQLNCFTERRGHERRPFTLPLAQLQREQAQTGNKFRRDRCLQSVPLI